MRKCNNKCVFNFDIDMFNNPYSVCDECQKEIDNKIDQLLKKVDEEGFFFKDLPNKTSSNE